MKTRIYKIAAIVLAVLLVCSVSVSVASAAGSEANLTYASAGRAPLSASEVYARNVNSTVGIRTAGTVNMFGYETVTAASGSGFVITDDGFILTNYHVVDDADEITVTMYNDESYKAELIGYDDSNDIAVLKIDAADLTPVVFGNSDSVVVGEDVVAIGNPLGELTFSLTRGIVSALDRDVTLSGNLRLKLIQTDCAINAGNSGGALFNMYGEVIGVTNAKYSSSGYGASVDNIAFAIPVNNVVDIVEQIMTKGEISRPYLGITVKDVSEELIAYGVPHGADVYSVEKDSPAEEAGLQKNDVITEANGKTVSGSEDLVKIIRACTPGDVVPLKVCRQGAYIDLDVTVGENIKSALPQETPEEKQPEQSADAMMPFMPFFEMR